MFRLKDYKKASPATRRIIDSFNKRIERDERVYVKEIFERLSFDDFKEAFEGYYFDKSGLHSDNE